nr:uncharacterized mitochondrial protein AtMg00810-like [Tanacetum cinerariifolium]
MVYQMDVKSAFLYGTIKEEVYACQPPGSEDPNHPDKVYKVVKALYGLHQAPRAWSSGKLASTPIDTEKPLLKVLDVKRIFRYLKGKTHLGLWYLKDSSFDLVAYSDSDYAGASLDRKSTTRECQFLGCRLISWQCKKQTVVATLSTEAEYVAGASCCAQVLWIQNPMLDYRLQALVDKKKVVVTEAAIRDALHLDDAEGVDCLPNEEIFTELARMGYEKSLVRNVDSSSKFYMYPRFIHLIIQNQLGVETPLFEGMLVAREPEEHGDSEEQGNDDNAAEEPDTAVSGDDVEDQSISSPTPPTPPPQQSQDIPSTS